MNTARPYFFLIPYKPLGCLVFLALAWALFAAPAAAADLMVPLSRSELIEVPKDMGEVIVADPEIADVYVHGKRRVSIIGKSLGRTTVRVFDPDSRLIRTVDVTVGYDLPAIRKTLKELLPYEMIGVEMVNTNIALTGQISSSSAADKAVKIVTEYTEPAYGKQGSGASTPAANAEDKIPKVLNLMTISSGQQVMLRVRVGEMKRSALRNIGLNMQAIKSGADSVFTIGTGGALTGTTTLVPGQYALDSDTRGFISGSLFNSSGNGLSAMLEALEQDGLLKVLAEPNLVAMSGEEAQFLAGGEFPIPVDAGGNDDDITIEFKPFGVSVKFLPMVLTDSRIRILVEPEVSEINLDPAGGAIVLGNLTIPALNTRRARTTLELAPGESFMIAGLIQDNMRSQISQLPGVSEVPILSALFRSTEFQREETELVLAVTPYLVDPLVSGDVKLPTDDFKPASVMESFFYGAIGSLSNDAERVSQTPSLEGPIGFMVD